MNTIRLQHFFAWFLRAAFPVDGCPRPQAPDRLSPEQRDEALQRREAEPHEPVRWGNFR